jgi:haloacetate dehalogenase
MTMRLPGFAYRRIEVDGVTINTAVAGDGPPLLLLHGYPQTHLIWRHIGGELARTNTVVLTDLRGYGDSAKPVPAQDNSTYSKRSMADDQIAVMAHLGFERFDLIGHDRGARVAHRLVLDHPETVGRLGVLDIVPTRHVLLHADRMMAAAYFHWFFLPTGDGIPEHLIGLDPAFWVRVTTERLIGDPSAMEPEVMAEYIRCFSDPAAIAASCADYRSAATVDLEHDDDSAAAAQSVRCPTLALWGEKSFVGKAYRPLEVWREYAANVRGRALPTGHFLPEEAPAEVLSEIQEFLASSAS